MVIWKVAPFTSLSKSPVPTKVASAPVSNEVGCKSVIFKWVSTSPQSSHVTAKVTASTFCSCSAKVFCGVVTTSLQNNLSPVSDVATECEVDAARRLAGISALIFTSVVKEVEPALSGNWIAFAVVVPMPKGSLQTTSAEASPLQNAICTPPDVMVIWKVAPFTSLSKSPVPTKVASAPVSNEVGCRSVIFKWVSASPQSSHVTAKVTASLQNNLSPVSDVATECVVDAAPC